MHHLDLYGAFEGILTLEANILGTNNVYLSYNNLLSGYWLNKTKKLLETLPMAD